MQRIFLLLLFLPFFSQSQEKKKQVHKKKVQVVVKPKIESSKKTTDEIEPIEAPKPFASSPNIDEVSPVESRIAEYKIEKPLFPASYDEALKEAAEKCRGVVLFIPNAFDSSAKDIAPDFFSDSVDKADYLNSMSNASNETYKIKFIFYSPTTQELNSQKIERPLLYPAYLFLDNNGNLIGKAEGVRMEPERILQQSENLMLMTLQRESDSLMEKYNNGSIDSIGLVDLILAMKKLKNTNHTDASGNSINEFDLLEAFLKKYASPKEGNKDIAHFIMNIYADGESISDIKRVNTINCLINNYDASVDTTFESYELISHAIAAMYDGAIDCGCYEGPLNVLTVDSIFNFHKKLIHRVRNIQLLNEGNKLMLSHYDFLTKKYPSNNVMTDAYWFFDSVLKVGNGMEYVKVKLRESAVMNLPEFEAAYFKNQYTDFWDFQSRFTNDLGLALNNISWEIFKIDSVNDYLPNFLEWSKASLEIEKSNPFYLDTYAQLLYAKGDKKGAIENEAKAVKVMQTDKKYTGLGNTKVGMTNVLNKMRAGKRVPRKDYAQ